MIITHHFFGRNRNNTDQVMGKIYPDLVDILVKFNAGEVTEAKARMKIAWLVTRKGHGKGRKDD